MTTSPDFDWNDAYENGAYIEDAQSYPARWADEALEFRSGWIKKDIDIIYGDTDRQRLDLFHSEDKSKGLVVFVHGGYWRRFDKSYWSHLARGALRSGWSVCLPSYELAPDVRIPQITAQIGTALNKAARRVEGPIRLSGHSAGGHLVSRMICEDTPLNPEVLERIEKVVSISGLHDLRPLMKTSMNEDFLLTEPDAVKESAALQKPAKDCPMTAWVGGDERPEFIRQSQLLAEAWDNAKVFVDEGKHHFDVIEGLIDPASPLTSELLSQ
ncbi:alpha/beta hydrolase [Roseibium sp.]|uniref:alpha/beta hydrolase n=1 Tax=Roseibium sp. TaxID=1936156 RepID=UPI00391D1DDB